MESQKGECDRKKCRTETAKPCSENNSAKHRRCDGLSLQQTCNEFRGNDRHGDRQDRHCIVKDRVVTHHWQCVPGLSGDKITAFWRKLRWWRRPKKANTPNLRIALRSLSIPDSNLRIIEPQSQ